MTPLLLEQQLDGLIAHQVRLSVMIWGPPGIGKSQIVQAKARSHGLACVDVRLSQLAPTDLRGLPVPDHEHKIARWYPPEFLPREGAGILFLDELNMAPPAVQGIAQQLILDRRIGAYEVPEGWFVWAAGNRREDRAAVFDMPAPLANRFLHLEVGPDFPSFRAWATRRGLHESILAFLAFRPALLHQPDPGRPAWPSPRSWAMADSLIRAGMGVEPAVGAGTAGEFTSFCKVYEKLPDVDKIMTGRGDAIPFPAEPSVRYALSTALALRPETQEQTAAACQWLCRAAPPEWTVLFLHLSMERAKQKRQTGLLAELIRREPSLQQFLSVLRDWGWK